jgi:hypothetical protein
LNETARAVEENLRSTEKPLAARPLKPLKKNDGRFAPNQIDVLFRDRAWLRPVRFTDGPKPLKISGKISWGGLSLAIAPEEARG